MGSVAYAWTLEDDGFQKRPGYDRGLRRSASLMTWSLTVCRNLAFGRSSRFSQLVGHGARLQARRDTGGNNGRV